MGIYQNGTLLCYIIYEEVYHRCVLKTNKLLYFLVLLKIITTYIKL